MTDKEFNQILDELLSTKKLSGDPGILDEMDQLQRYTINSVKKSLRRINES